jgi:hypothetical protein
MSIIAPVASENATYIEVQMQELPEELPVTYSSLVVEWTKNLHAPQLPAYARNQSHFQLNENGKESVRRGTDCNLA